MQIMTTKDIYALSALLELAANSNRGPVQIKEISKAQGIPENYLRQIMISLKKAGLAKSVQGKKGGYIISKEALNITLKEIFEKINGPLLLFKLKPKDPTLAFYLEWCQKEFAKMCDHTLAGLASEKQKRDKNYIYNI